MTENKTAIIKLALNQPYQPEIMGLGEIYEIISVEYRQKILQQKFEKGIMFIGANKNYRGRGLTLSRLKRKVCQEGFEVLASGFVDSPPWPSRPRVGNKSPLLKYLWLVMLAKFISKILVFLEFLWQGDRFSHMIYVFGRKRQE